VSRRRVAAIVALLVAAATIPLAVATIAREFPRGLWVSACVLVAASAGWFGVLRRGVPRVAGLAGAALALGGIVALLVTGGGLLAWAVVACGVVAAVAAARASVAVHVALPPATPPRHPVLFFNPRSGGGKAERLALADEARSRGIEPLELKPGDDLEMLVRGAIARGADALAMAGSDDRLRAVAAGHRVGARSAVRVRARRHP
jgi:hypothetical protein